MKTYKISERPLAEEREFHISLTLNENDEWKSEWKVDTNIPEDINAFKERGWEQTSKEVLSTDGTVQCTTFKSTSKEKSTLTEEQIAKLRASLQKNIQEKRV